MILSCEMAKTWSLKTQTAVERNFIRISNWKWTRSIGANKVLDRKNLFYRWLHLACFPGAVSPVSLSMNGYQHELWALHYRILLVLRSYLLRVLSRHIYDKIHLLNECICASLSVTFYQTLTRSSHALSVTDSFTHWTSASFWYLNSLSSNLRSP